MTAGTAADPQASTFWIGAATSGAIGTPARGVRRLAVRRDGGHTLGPAIDVGPDPRFIARDSSGTLVVAHELAEGAISVWDALDPTLRQRTGATPTGGASPCHVAFDQDGIVVYAANYRGASVSAHRLSDSSRASAVTFSGSGPHAERQRASHPHQVVVDVARSRLLVPDLGADLVRVIDVDPIDGAQMHHRPERDIRLHAGAGPRHLVVVGARAIVANELDRTVSIVDLVSGSELGWNPIARTRGVGAYGASAIRLTPAGTVLIGDRERNAVQTLRWMPGETRLVHVAETATGGRHPRDFELTRDGSILVVADQASDSLSILQVDDDGVPGRMLARIPTPAPTCVLRIDEDLV
ncbi:lactonase family protein [Agromyces sp. SYSU T00266]|uniref:lactonase family protein n=1 Tax=Agromyces zhanjiangensis TaxID=3158562 RepID=UPI00339B6A7E